MDDTLVIPENLLYHLSKFNSSEAWAVGDEIPLLELDISYLQGGCGFGVSRGAIAKMITKNNVKNFFDKIENYSVQINFVATTYNFLDIRNTVKWAEKCIRFMYKQ